MGWREAATVPGRGRPPREYIRWLQSQCQRLPGGSQCGKENLNRADGPVFDTPSQRLRLDKATDSEDLFPEYLRPVHLKEQLGVSQALRSMLERKERAFVHERHRYSDLTNVDT